MTQDVGNVELFELLEADPKTQCNACLSDLCEGIVYCTCGHLLKKEPIEVSLKIHWTFSQFQNISSRREDLTATEKGNFKQRILPGP